MFPSERQGWERIRELHPAQVEQVFGNVLQVLRPHMCGCSLMVVGSFSDGRAEYIVRGKQVLFASDIDLLLIVPDGRKDVLRSRHTVSSALRTVATTVSGVDGSFHIGLRYRFVSELPDFGWKCASLGYDFLHHGLVIHSGCPLDVKRTTGRFGVGHCAENLCSKLWVILRYADPRRHALTFGAPRRKVERALECMDASVRYLNAWTRHAGSTAEVFRTDALAGSVARRVAQYGRLARALTEKVPELCVEASANEEFDFFRVAGAECVLLPRFLIALLRLGWRLGRGQPHKWEREQIETMAEQLGLGQSAGRKRQEDGLELFWRMRQSMAAKRMALSPLFRRDRGPTFLRSLIRVSA